MQQKILKTGNSLAVTIPAGFVKTLGLKPGQTVVTKIDLPHARLVHVFPTSGQLPLLPKHAPSS